MKVSYIGQGIESLSKKGKKVVSKPVLPVFSPEQVRNFQTLFRFLNDKDRDILYLIFVAKKKQNAVQHILDRSQPSIHYDIKRIQRRLQFICYLNSMFDSFVNFLESERSNEYGYFAKEILVLMFYTSSFTTTAKILNEEQMRVRYRFDRTLEFMTEKCDWDMYELFLTIRNNLNLIRRIYKARESCEVM